MRAAEGERGLVSLEFALFAVVLIGATLLVSMAWRVTEAGGQVRDAASEAARAASLVQEPAAAQAAAFHAAVEALGKRKVSCSQLTVEVDTGQLHPGGVVSVLVSCVADLEDLALIGVPGSMTLAATALEVVDTRRGGE